MQVAHPLSGLKSRRINAGVKARELANLLGVETPSYYRFENGDRRIYLDKAIAIAQRLGCTLEQLAIEPDTVADLDFINARNETPADTGTVVSARPPRMTADIIAAHRERAADEAESGEGITLSANAGRPLEMPATMIIPDEDEDPEVRKIMDIYGD